MIKREQKVFFEGKRGTKFRIYLIFFLSASGLKNPVKI